MIFGIFIENIFGFCVSKTSSCFSSKIGRVLIYGEVITTVPKKLDLSSDRTKTLSWFIVKNVVPRYSFSSNASFESILKVETPFMSRLKKSLNSGEIIKIDLSIISPHSLLLFILTSGVLKIALTIRVFSLFFLTYISTGIIFSVFTIDGTFNTVLFKTGKAFVNSMELSFSLTLNSIFSCVLFENKERKG